MNFQDYILDQALVLIPVLYIIGMFIKKSEVPDKYIPLTLLVIGILFSLFLVGFNVQGIIQGVLVAGTAVFADQVAKQASKDE